jgi:hypothetical protein
MLCLTWRITYYKVDNCLIRNSPYSTNLKTPDPTPTPEKSTPETPEAPNKSHDEYVAGDKILVKRWVFTKTVIDGWNNVY